MMVGTEREQLLVMKIRAFANTIFNPVIKEGGCWLFHLEALMVGSYGK